MASACAGLPLGREFPPPDAAQIKVNVMDKAGRLSVFGEPYQSGLDSGDRASRWFYARTSTSDTMTKDFTVRFNANGSVKSYSFTSNLPEDMTKLR